jgi:hypothetical protein
MGSVIGSGTDIDLDQANVRIVAMFGNPTWYSPTLPDERTRPSIPRENFFPIIAAFHDVCPAVL